MLIKIKKDKKEFESRIEKVRVRDAEKWKHEEEVTKKI